MYFYWIEHRHQTAYHFLPKTMVSFAFDAQLDYLAFAHLAVKCGTHPINWSEELKGRKPFGPLIGGLRILL